MGIAASSSPLPPPETSATGRRVAEGAEAATDAGGGGADDAAEMVVGREGECEIDLFMKGGGCKEEFVAWAKCMDEAEAAGNDDAMERCYEAAAALLKCMEAHADYYEPILRKAGAGLEHEDYLDDESYDEDDDEDGSDTFGDAQD